MNEPTTRASVREQKAEALDVLVKKEIARTKVADSARIDRLRALRLTHEEQQRQEETGHQNAGDRPKRKTMHLRSPGQ